MSVSTKEEDIVNFSLVRNDYCLEIEGVEQKFGSLIALQDVCINIKAGERRAILGSNGAGKTTLFNAITGDVPPSSGKIFLFGEDISDWTIYDRIRFGLRRTYQKSLLFNELSVFDNLFLASQGVKGNRFNFKQPYGSNWQDSEKLDQIFDLIKFVHLTEEINTLVKNLSYGKQRQLEIGMVMVGAPRLILFDEPAAGLSPSERTWLIDLLGQLPTYIDFAIIEHDLDVALKVVDRVTMMDNGRVFKEGSPEEIQNDPEVQKIYLGSH